MPFQSKKQQRYLWANEPKVAMKWSKEEKSKKRPTRPKRRANAR